MVDPTNPAAPDDLEPEDLLPEDVPGEAAPVVTPEQYERDKWAEKRHSADVLFAPNAYVPHENKDSHPEDDEHSSSSPMPGGLV